MALSQTTADQITNYYGNLVNNDPSASTLSTAAPASTTSTTSATSTPPASSSMIASVTGTPNVNNWYRSNLGRDAEAGGANYWQSRLDSGANAGDVYADFQKAAQQNGENYHPVDFSQANNYTGAMSENTATPVDDWGRNVLGRELTPTELTNWQQRFSAAGGTGAAGAQQVYQDFLTANAGEVKRPMDWASASQINTGLTPLNPVVKPSVTTLDLNDLDKRTIDPGTETVRGQMRSLLDENGVDMQRADYLGRQQAAERGLINSTMAGTAGQAALIDHALQIATPDASTFGKASDYNVAARNQARMWNADQQNQFARQQMDIMAQQQRQQAQIGADTATQGRQLSDNAASRANQVSIAQLQAETSKWQTELNSTTSRYNTDAQYRQQADNNKKTLVNNIINNMDLAPDRKAALLHQLGEDGLASAIFIVDSTAADLTGNPLAPAHDGGGG